jgi:hypothetical protein
LASSSATKEKSFITLTPGINVRRRFPSSLTAEQNKLECLSSASFLRLVEFLRLRLFSPFL